MRVAVLVALAASAASCAHSAPPPRDARLDARRAPPQDGWATSSWEDRHDTMTFLVLPNMARTFQTFFGKSDPDMTCETCHGPDPESVAYKMPRGLPALDPRDLPSRHAADPRKARMAAFMVDEVTPRMARMLERPLSDPSTRTGLSCFSCHPSL